MAEEVHHIELEGIAQDLRRDIMTILTLDSGTLIQSLGRSLYMISL